MYQSFDTWQQKLCTSFFKAFLFLPFLSFFLFLFCQNWKYHGKPEKFNCWVNVDLRQALFKIFDQYDTGSLLVRYGINLVSTTDWYRPYCLEHFPKSEKSLTRPFFWLMSTQQRTNLILIKCYQIDIFFEFLQPWCLFSRIDNNRHRCYTALTFGIPGIPG